MNIACASEHNGFRNSSLVSELDHSLAISDMSFRSNDPRSIRLRIESQLRSSGWASGLQVPGGNLKISYFRNRTGMSVQLGNVSRTYADLLKLHTIYANGMIDEAVIAVPTLDAAKALGSNHANYERLCREIGLFKQTITVPILVLGLGG